MVDHHGRPFIYNEGPFLHSNRAKRRAAGIRTPLAALLEYRDLIGELEPTEADIEAIRGAE